MNVRDSEVNVTFQRSYKLQALDLVRAKEKLEVRGAWNKRNLKSIESVASE